MGVESNDHSNILGKLESGEMPEIDSGLFDPGGRKNANGETGLMIAAKIGHVELARVLHQGGDIDDKDLDGWTALLNAAHQGHEEIVKILLEAGASVDLCDLMGWTPLLWAAYKNHPSCVKLLLDKGARVNVCDEEDGLTPLIVAAGRGYNEIVDLLLSKNAEVNACDKFGSTALIWAARSGHYNIVTSLLDAGSEIDAIGMYSSTSLMLACKGNHVQVVDALLYRSPNLNISDSAGMTALGIASREGHFDIVQNLISEGANVNCVDHSGNTVLMNAVRSGNLTVVKMLLEKHAELNAKDKDGRTALHMAIDKGYMDVILSLVEKKPNLEIKNNEGDTPLLRAVKNRHPASCQLLVKAGAKVATTDNAGDNALHLALRARSRRLTQSLLINPANMRLLYRPNKLGETPYSIDQNNASSVLPVILGCLGSDAHLNAMLGYDIYSDVLADVLCEPNLTLPLTLGLYAKWGSGKSMLIAKLKQSMNSFARKWYDGVQFIWSWLIVFFITIFCLFLALFTITLTSFLSNSAVTISIGISCCVLYVFLIIFYGLVYYGSEIKNWHRSSVIAGELAKTVSNVRLFMNIATLDPPLVDSKDLLTSPVSFLFADYHRLSSIGGEQALARIVLNLFEAAENHFGRVTFRFCSTLDTPNGTKSTYSRMRRICGVPVLLLMAIFIICLIASLVLLSVWLFGDKHSFSRNFIASAVLLTIPMLLLIYPVYIFVFRIFVNGPKRRISKAARFLPKIRFEGFMHKLQEEIKLLSTTIRMLDAFTSSQTRLVVIVDGLDNCEQEKMVQTLDALDLLFAAHPDRPFIVIIAVDPHIIISAINHNMYNALTGTELTGYDFLKNKIWMPLYIHNSAVKQLQKKLYDKRESVADWKERFKRQDTLHGSILSLNGADVRAGRKSTTFFAFGFGKSILTDDYFSNMNPRAMKRIVNALTLTGRLLRAFEIDFSWITLGYWVSLIEQWPYRMCWLIDRALDMKNDHHSLLQVYNQLKHRIPKKDSLVDLDRNPDNFEPFLEQSCQSQTNQLTVAMVRRFVPCTSNLDPYLRKLIRDRRMDLEQSETIIGVQTAPSKLAPLLVTGPARYLFKNNDLWSSIDCTLAEMKLESVVNLIRKLDIDENRMKIIVQRLNESNLNGLVLSACDLSDVRRSLRLNLGDWTMVKLLIETLRNWEPRVTSEIHCNLPAAVARSTSLASIQEQKRRLTAKSEIESDHQWLMESLYDMDQTEAEVADVVASQSRDTSVKFDDDSASEKDSTESLYGSKEKLLDLHGTQALLPIREDEKRLVRMDSVRSEQSNGLFHIPSEEQLTIVPRMYDGKPSLHDIFQRDS